MTRLFFTLTTCISLSSLNTLVFCLNLPLVLSREDARGAGCPPNALEVATRFQIPPPQAPDPSRTTNYIEVKITRNNLYEFGGGVNSSGGEEIVIRAPLLPTGVRTTGGA
jgi:hypothetical protein